MSKSIAIIGSGEMAVIIADEARRMGIVSHSFSNNPTDRVLGHSDQHHDVDIFNVHELVSICQDLSVSGVISTTELTVSIAAKVAHEMGLNGMPVSVSEMVTDKGLVREKVSKITSIKQPIYNILNIGEKLPQIQKYPVVVKPTAMGGKRGVSVVGSDNELQAAIEYSIENMPASMTRIIIESYVWGKKEYSVESLSFNGSHKVIQITEKITSGPPNCVELGHMQPAEVPDKIRRKIECTIPELLTAVGVDNTSAHTEIKLVGDDIYLIELNARLGGDHISYPLTGLSTGYPYIQGAIAVAMGDYEEPDTDKFDRNACGVIFVTKQTSEVKHLFDECEQYPWLYKKNKISEELKEIINNQAFDTNYMIYKSNEGLPQEIKRLLVKQ
ncbi:ATP-grasp domain-containing protein [Clostridium algidicarnis]|uniref:ATP-grasp domain-containing protein n=1 Tax=Clostridium algidicarnis TaxID=37659 RepID=UPI001C0ABF3B|nr:ATP-grasp domain-containing protein [Clostridium algidicarnis]MBU3205219.1 ATP-grasp domain-containing protein [Clostridium algidicarnis]MBU3213372.1 ATP-grasp domain-containing protein [Clostridium algidicarnis]MBU3223315.1 ATP-grasp domain-containing protein [Clostridium algidicarnis]